MLIDNKDGRYPGLPELFNVDQGFVDVRAENIIRESESGEIGRDEARLMAIAEAAALVFPAPLIPAVPEPVEVVAEEPVEVPDPVEVPATVELSPDNSIPQEDLFGDPQPEHPSDSEV